MLGDSRGPPWRCTFDATPLDGIGAGSSSVLRVGRRLRRTGCANALISVIETRSGFGCHTPLTAPAVERSRGTRPGASSRWSAGSRACPTSTRLGPRQPPARPPARATAALDGHDWGRQGSPTRCTCWAVRLAALRRSRPRRSLRCWPGLPPTRPRPLPRPGRPPPDDAGMPVGLSTAMPVGTRPAAPSPAGPADGSTQRGTGGSEGKPAPKPNRPGPSGGPGGLEGGGSWSTSPRAVRVQAVGLVGAGQPVGEVAGALGVHPAALRRWVWQAWHRWGSPWA
jgi:hypothetical protein